MNHKKLVISLSIIIVGGMIMLVGGFMSFNEASYFAVALLGILISATSFIYSCIFIRCHNCRTKLFWHAITHYSADMWLYELFKRSKCPKCMKDLY